MRWPLQGHDIQRFLELSCFNHSGGFFPILIALNVLVGFVSQQLNVRLDDHSDIECPLYDIFRADEQ
jgi:hypothetical protein